MFESFSEANGVKYANGEWNNNKIHLKRLWGKNDNWKGHLFTEKECVQLFNGEPIEFKAISKKGSEYMANGRLGISTYTDKEGNEKQYIGFCLNLNNAEEVERFTGKWNGQDVAIKRAWGGHYFTDEEVTKLLNDEVIEFDAISKKSGEKYTAKGKLAEQEYNGKKFIGFCLQINT